MTVGLRDGSRSLASIECRMKTFDKASALEVDRLVQEADRSAVQCACLNPLVGIGRYENDWYLEAEMRQMICSSTPLIFGNCTSNIRHRVSPTTDDWRKASADANVRVANPSDLTRASRAPRIHSSSSTIDMSEVSIKSSFRHR